MSTDRFTSEQSKRLTSAEDRLDSLCDSFELSWKQGKPLPIDTLLRAVDQTEQPQLFFELLALDVAYRKQSSNELTARDYLRRFPQFREQVHRAALTGILSSISRELGSDSASCLEVGAQIRQYELVEQIGRGSSGEVWKAIDLHLSRIVAIKIPHARLSTEEEQLRFLQEAHAAARLQHPNIVSVHEVGRAGSRIFLVADFIDGPNLSQWLVSSQASPTFAASTCATLADSLHYAHELGIVHRDLKPANIILDSNIEPHITDFGLAKSLDNPLVDTLEGQLLGTPAYMSPEQARSDKSIDRRSDVFSLGIVLFELMTRVRPFDGDLATVLHQILNDEPLPPTKILQCIPPDLEAICLKALEKDVARRYQSAKEMSDDLRRFLRGEPVSARRPNFAERSWRIIRRRQALSLSIACAISAVTSLGAAGILARKNRNLLGLKSVSIATEPPNAKLTIISIDPVTGHPTPATIIQPTGTSPLSVDLAPGYYLIVACSGNGCFHEVFRTVPSNTQSTPLAYNHLFWSALDEDSIRMPTIDIPLRPQLDRMAKLKLKNGKMLHVDCSEFTLRDYLPLNNGILPAFLANKPLDSPEEVHYEEAVSRAEASGKRLPTFDEYLVIAKSLESNPASQQGLQVSGLFSGIAEWTSTTAPKSVKDLHSDSLRNIVGTEGFRIVCGTTTTNKAPAIGDAYPWTLELRNRSNGIGFRCVRSERPSF